MVGQVGSAVDAAVNSVAVLIEEVLLNYRLTNLRTGSRRGLLLEESCGRFALGTLEHVQSLLDRCCLYKSKRFYLRPAVVLAVVGAVFIVNDVSVAPVH